MLLSKLFKLFPEGSLKNKIRCYYFNHFRKYNFHTSYKNYYFQFEFENGITLKIYDGVWGDLTTSLKRYLSEYKLKKGDVVIDCGAYVGAFALYAAKIVGSDGQVFAFEPDILNYKKLVNNIKLNNITNIIAINKGIWSKNTILKFNNEGLQISSFFFSEIESTINVPVVMLDNELKERGIKKVDFMKMDIEGAEIEAVKGSEKILKNNDVNLAIASYHIIKGQKTCFELEKLLSKFGYEVKTSLPEHLTTYAQPK